MLTLAWWPPVKFSTENPSLGWKFSGTDQGREGRTHSTTQKPCTGTLWGKDAVSTCRSLEVEINLLHVMSFLLFLISRWTGTKQVGKFMVQELEMRPNNLIPKLSTWTASERLCATAKSIHLYSKQWHDIFTWHIMGLVKCTVI